VTSKPARLFIMTLLLSAAACGDDDDDPAGDSCDLQACLACLDEASAGDAPTSGSETLCEAECGDCQDPRQGEEEPTQCGIATETGGDCAK
jgi:hypothetical protein